MMEINETNPAGVACVAASFEKWREFPYSAISHHGGRCCDIAREWVLSIDFSQLNGGSPLTGPRWLRQKYAWGPSPWPMHWCEAVERETLDCGALASLSHEVFTARGVRSHPAQFIQQYTGEATCHWRHKWAGEECSPHWLENDLIYHEGCAVVTRGDEIRLWDASAGWWVNPKQFGGYGGVLALKVFAQPAGAPAAFKWGTHLIEPNCWHEIEAARADFAAEDIDEGAALAAHA
jgi:hypothetical protein